MFGRCEWKKTSEPLVCSSRILFLSLSNFESFFFLRVFKTVYCLVGATLPFWKSSCLRFALFNSLILCVCVHVCVCCYHHGHCFIGFISFSSLFTGLRWTGFASTVRTVWLFVCCKPFAVQLSAWCALIVGLNMYRKPWIRSRPGHNFDEQRKCAYQPCNVQLCDASICASSCLEAALRCNVYSSRLLAIYSLTLSLRTIPVYLSSCLKKAIFYMFSRLCSWLHCKDLIQLEFCFVGLYLWLSFSRFLLEKQCFLFPVQFLSVPG